MDFGIYGLGRMGQAIVGRLLRHGHVVHVYNRSPEPIAALVAEGAQGAASLSAFVGQMSSPRCIWLMLPAGEATEQAIAALAALLSPGDILIDGGNSYWRDAPRRAALLAPLGIHFLDVGTSGGVHGLERGFCLMVGGPDDAVDMIDTVFTILAPDRPKMDDEIHPNNTSRRSRPGFVRSGASGSGHFVKMVHNGIEYGMMQAIAEGFGILKAKEEFGLDLAQVSHIWQHGSVVRSWLLDLAANALDEDQALTEIKPWVADSGEGRWTVFESIDLDVPAPIITLALQMRFASRDEENFPARMLAALRNQFGGHAIKKAE
jgi:6-phosphogluconate dehydrogenase